MLVAKTAASALAGRLHSSFFCVRDLRWILGLASKIKGSEKADYNNGIHIIIIIIAYRILFT